MISINPIPAFRDNYLWLLDDGQRAVVVDPGDAVAVHNYLKKHNLDLEAILVTHHHSDHTAGIAQLKNQYQCTVYGPKNDVVDNLDYRCCEGQTIAIASMPAKFEVIEVPGHTLGHIAFFLPSNQLSDNLLFCGDTLFSGGCGRLFEGTAAQMLNSLQKIMSLPDNTQIYPAHEYTLSNLNFAIKIDPNNSDLKRYREQVTNKRDNNMPTLPTTLLLEKKINPFLRTQSPAIIDAIEKQVNQSDLSPEELFKAVRTWKDKF